MSRGSVRQDVDRGTWLLVVDVPSQNGTRRQHRERGFATKKTAQHRLTEVLASVDRGGYVRPARVTLGEFLLDEWLPARARSVRPSTLASYEVLIRAYVVPRLGGVALAGVDGPILNRFYGELLDSGRSNGRGLSAKSVRNVAGLLHKAFADAVRWQRIVRNPADAADPPGRPHREMAAWSASQLREFLDHARADRWHPLWLLAATTGARRGELLGARWSDLDLDGGRWTISQARTVAGHRETVGAPKTSAGARTVALDPATAATLRAWRRQQLAERLVIGPNWPDVDLVFLEADGTAPKPETISRRFAAAVAATDLPRIRLHDLRHTHATIALSSGISPHVVSRRLGHANITVTLGLYAHLLPGDDEAAAATVAGAVLGNSVTNP